MRFINIVIVLLSLFFLLSERKTIIFFKLVELLILFKNNLNCGWNPIYLHLNDWLRVVLFGFFFGQLKLILIWRL